MHQAWYSMIPDDKAEKKPGLILEADVTNSRRVRDFLHTVLP